MATESPQPHSRAFIEEKIFLRSDEAQHVEKRSGHYVIVSLQKISMVLGYITKDKQISEVESLVDKAIDKTAAEIAAEIARAQKLLADNGITITPQFNHPVTITVTLTTPAAVAYYGLIQQLDELMLLIHKLWFGRVWDNQQCRVAGITWQRKLMSLANNINDIEQRAWKAFRKKGKPGETQKELIVNVPQANASATAPEASSEDTATGELILVPAPSATAVPATADEAAANGEPTIRGKAVAA